ncbi:hypothetical protein O181_017300 [Austropuccinia psidii MF-1]|uniref:Uncharacterized protein n=1 Tax=Austropuccinia psidii MF-1 TaxID=1389203 RepID=A0A9Q3C7I4_9BASI|nr:hypothetical protein [Austropuccinia psidii MF-1]
MNRGEDFQDNGKQEGKNQKKCSGKNFTECKAVFTQKSPWDRNFGNSQVEKEKNENMYDREQDTQVMEYELHEDWVSRREEEEHLKQAMRYVKVPFGITKFLSAIGDPKTGKLKARKWNSLFSLYLPLSIMDLNSVSSYGLGKNEGRKENCCLKNFQHLQFLQTFLHQEV